MSDQVGLTEAPETQEDNRSIKELVDAMVQAADQLLTVAQVLVTLSGEELPKDSLLNRLAAVLESNSKTDWWKQFQNQPQVRPAPTQIPTQIFGDGCFPRPSGPTWIRKQDCTYGGSDSPWSGLTRTNVDSSYSLNQDLVKLQLTQMIADFKSRNAGREQ